MALDQARLLTIALLILISQTGLIVFLLLQQHKQNQRINALESRPFAQVKGLPVGTQAPNFNALNLQGETIAFWSLLEAKKMIVLVFFDANCQPCLTVVDNVRKWQEAYAKNLNFVLLGRSIDTQSDLENYTGLTVLRQNDREISNRFQGKKKKTYLKHHNLLTASLQTLEKLEIMPKNRGFYVSHLVSVRSRLPFVPYKM
jgi:peroxiredoxin